ncbi:MepB family protein [Bacillus sp. TL12]|uniref:MepB family protein n=1 Tax=Bacillus sp. TL12 TaxID=2894756 RepID=UPI001F529D80|nr:MepB family protein [Bacillus sp. TL12]MCI0768095.1 MepB family protein [Bacillus sp. TL12]
MRIIKKVSCDKLLLTFLIISVSNKGQGDKRAIRVYPPWDKLTSRQNQKKQIWQLKCFLEIPVKVLLQKSEAACK